MVTFKNFSHAQCSIQEIFLRHVEYLDCVRTPTCIGVEVDVFYYFFFQCPTLIASQRSPNQTYFFPSQPFFPS